VSERFFVREGHVFAASQWGGLYLAPGDIEKMIAAWSQHPDNRPPFARAVCEEMLADLRRAVDEAQPQELAA